MNVSKFKKSLIGFLRTRLEKDPLIRAGVVSVVSTGIACGIACGVVRLNSYNYWTGTIYRTQTVDFNILSNLLPAKISTYLSKVPLSIDDINGLQKSLDSNYGLFGIVITDCKSINDQCSKQNIIYASKSKVEHISSGRQKLVAQDRYVQKWTKKFQNQDFSDKLLISSPFVILRDPPPLHQEWGFETPSNDKKVLYDKQNKGKVIGRAYFIRPEVPKIDNELKSLGLVYTSVAISALITGLLILLSIEFSYYLIQEAENKEAIAVRAQIKAEKSARLAQEDTKIAIKAKEQAQESARLAQEDSNLAIEKQEQAEKYALLALEDSNLAIEKQEQAQESARLAQEDSNLAIKEKEQAQESARLAQEDTKLAIKEKEQAQESARLAQENSNLAIAKQEQAQESARLAQENTKLAIKEKKQAQESARLAQQDTKLAIKEKEQAEESAHLAQENSNLAIAKQEQAEESARLAQEESNLAIEKQEQAEESARLAQEDSTIAIAKQKQAEESVRLAQKDSNLAIIEKEEAEEFARLAQEDSNLAIEKQKQAEESARLANQEIDSLKTDNETLFNEIQEDNNDRIQQLKDENENLTNENRRLTNQECQRPENTSSNPKNNEQDVVIKSKEKDYYSGERKDIIIDALRIYMTSTTKDSRREHIAKDIVKENIYDGKARIIKDDISRILRERKSTFKGDLQSLGFDFISENEHFKFKWKGDSRYQITLPKTPSEGKGTNNAISTISNKIL